MPKEKYTLGWTDFLTLEQIIRVLKENPNIKIIDDKEVLEIQFEHTLEANSDKEAKNYADEYSFGGYDGVCFSLLKGEEVIYAEEDIYEKRFRVVYLPTAYKHQFASRSR